MISVQNNITAMTANRNLNINSSIKSKSMFRLSSGYSINRAADNSAGLSISEKMRSQIRGLDQASDNIQDGISLLQTADGALSEVHSMLQRMTTLTVQASNDTNTIKERQAIEKEISDLKLEINRIGHDTEFNTMKLFDGQKISNDNNLSTTTGRNYNLAGTPVDTTITDYAVTADVLLGVSINDNNSSWSSISDTLGNTLGDDLISAGKYSLSYNGVSLSFDVSASDTLEAITRAIGGLQFQVNVTPPKTSSISSLNFKLFTPTESPSISKDEFLNFIDQGSHIIFADEFGIGIDITSNTSWEDMFSNAGVSKEDGLKNGGTFTVGEPGKFELAIEIKPNSTIDSIIEELNGVVFDIDGKVSNHNVTECITPVGGIDATALSDLSLSNSFSQALGYNLSYMYDDDIVAVYNTLNTVEPENKYRIGIEFASNPENPSGHGMVLWLDTASKSRLESIFTPGDKTTTNGEVQLDFVNSLYGSSFSVSFQYLASMSYSDLFNNLNGQQAVKYTVNSTYQVSNLNTNPIDTTPKVDFQIDTSGLSSDDNSPQVGKDVFGRFAIQAGANSGQAIFLDIDKMDCTVLGLDDLSIFNSDEASNSITKLHAAVDTISKQRGKLGAYQNRLEHALNNADNSSENLQVAESRIRDTDMAKEIVVLSRQSILEQASQAMLSQANQSSNRVLQLLE